MTIFKSCDIRGVAGDEWTPADARIIGRSLGNMMHRRGQSQICVGGDFRRSTPDFKRAFVEGLVESGAFVYDAGQLPTPVAYFAARDLGCLNVAIVTASHNPGKYNGIKFVIGGRPAVPDLVSELQAGLDASPASRQRGSVASRDALADYESETIALSQTMLAANAQPFSNEVDGDSQAEARPQPLHVIVDTMGGAFAGLANRVLVTVGYSTASLRGAIDPDFAVGPPNPASDANLVSLIEKVAQQGADLGIALDGDGDRVIFVDSAAHIVRPEQVAALLVRHCFQQPTVVFDLKCASVVPRIVEASGGTSVMRPSGHGFIKTTMIETRAELGVEVSGHHFFGALGGGDDGLLTALIVAGLVAGTKKPLAELMRPFGWPAITPDLRVPFHGDAVAEVDRIAARCGGKISRLDGVRAEYDDGWALARASITEPAITLRMEGRDPECLREIAVRFLSGAPELQREILERID